MKQVLHTLRYSNSASFCSQARITFVLPDALAQLIPEEIGTPFRSVSSTLGCRVQQLCHSANEVTAQDHIIASYDPSGLGIKRIVHTHVRYYSGRRFRIIKALS